VGNSNLRVQLRLGTVITLIAVTVATALASPAQGAVLGGRAEARSAALPRPVAELQAVGTRYVRAPIPIRGDVRQAPGRNRLVLQRSSPAQHRWSRVASTRVGNGSYRFAPQHRRSPGSVAFRTVLYGRGRTLAVSNVIIVRVVARKGPRPTCAGAPSPKTCPRPRSFSQRRTVTDPPYCPQLTVTTRNQNRTIGWRWSRASRRWVQAPTAWVTVSTSKRAARAAECIKVTSQVPAGAVLPDLRIKDLTKCGRGDLAATNNTCFKIDPAAAFDADFPSLAGRKLLKFGVITLNAGAGPGEVVADRSATNAVDWRAYQSFYNADGHLLGSVEDPGVQFYFAGDGHNHWHVRDFDEYTLLDAAGTAVARAEKHGYCMQDNTTYDPMQGHPGVPSAPVYTESTSCGKGLPNALSIIHGLSSGWGDTYPTRLPDQAIDVTGLPDGQYTVRVHADAVGAVRESNEANNTAQVRIQLTGNTVTVVPGSSSGGL
jgi:hypothetical protein